MVSSQTVLPAERLRRRAEIVQSVRASVTRWGTWIEEIHASQADAYATDVETADFLEAELLRLAPGTQEYRRVATEAARARRSAAAWATKLAITPKAMKSAPKRKPTTGGLGTVEEGNALLPILFASGGILDPERPRDAEDPEVCDWGGNPPAMGAGCSKGVCDRCPNA